MSRLPNRNELWAKEAIGALRIAFSLLHEEEYDDLSFEEKQMEMLNLAPALAGMKRRIKDDKMIKETYDYVFKRIEEDSKRSLPDEEPNFEIIFLLAYLDSHVNFKLITEERAEKIMDHIVNHCEIPEFA